ncbi:hypothetical protein [Xinfangfangia pollutisoli]|uniref:hypothetical protein n=1 Tax=Xinfangfangia pollutisoli TaxID=2865960 RepID=UPI001CD55B3D|nr:hypothetical protein [Xinfangfangia pollutisoli]
MTDRARLDRLAQIAALLEEAGTAKRRAAAAARAAVKAQIAALEASRPQQAPQTAAEARVAFAYEQWASRRHAALNIQLARHEADCLSARDAARHAFGRARVIDRLLAQHRPKPPAP